MILKLRAGEWVRPDFATFHAIDGLDPRTLVDQDLGVDDRLYHVEAVEAFAIANATGTSFGLRVKPIPMISGVFDQDSSEPVEVEFVELAGLTGIRISPSILGFHSVTLIFGEQKKTLVTDTPERFEALARRSFEATLNT